jgi:hypothetical protein
MRTIMRSISSAGTILASLVALAALAPSEVEAQRRPMYAGFGGGLYAIHETGYDIHGRLQGEFGFHFTGDDTGFFLAVEAVTTFGSRGNDFLMFFGGLRLGGDIEVYGNRSVGIMLRPSGLVGFGFHDYAGPGNTWGFFVLQPAFDVRFAVADHLLAFWIRPVAWDFLFYWDRSLRDVWITAGYQFLIGLDFQF